MSNCGNYKARISSNSNQVLVEIIIRHSYNNWPEFTFLVNYKRFGWIIRTKPSDKSFIKARKWAQKQLNLIGNNKAGTYTIDIINKIKNEMFLETINRKN